MNSFYPTDVLHTIGIEYRLLHGFIIGLGIMLCALQIEPAPISSWRTINVPENSAHPLQPPAIFDTFIIWHKFEDSALTFYDFSTNTPLRHDWLHGKPIQWSAYQVESRIYLLWRTGDNHLWLALLGEAGEQLTAPISIAGNVSNFRADFSENKPFLVLWQNNRTLQMTTIDREGRPRPAVTLLETVDAFALVGENVVWQDGNLLYAGTIDFNRPQPVLQNAVAIPTFTLQLDEALSGLHIFLTENRRIILWGKIQVMRPDVEYYAGVILPLEGMADPVPFELALPDNVPLRWATVSENGVVMAAYLTEKWLPILVDFSDHGPQGFQMVEGAEVLASPPVAHGQYVAWTTLNEQGMPILYIAAYEPATEKYDRSRPAQRIRHGLEKSYWMVTWLILPALLLHFGWDTAALLAYWTGKIFFPFSLFDAPPTLIDWLDSPFSNTILTLVLISLLALVMRYIGWQNTPIKIRWVAYFLTDALLTFAFFGS